MLTADDYAATSGHFHGSAPRDYRMPARIETAAEFTFLMIPVPAADALVRATARRFEPASPTASLAAELVAAHITVLSPFMPRSRVDDTVIEDLRRICAGHPRHAIDLARVATFDGLGVYLQPEPSTVLLDLMQAVWRRWPEWPPYDGQFAQVIPHLTLAIVADERQAAEVAVFAEPWLPIRTAAAEVQLIQVAEGTWTLLDRFELGRVAPPTEH